MAPDKSHQAERPALAAGPTSLSDRRPSRDRPVAAPCLGDAMAAVGVVEQQGRPLLEWPGRHGLA